MRNENSVNNNKLQTTLATTATTENHKIERGYSFCHCILKWARFGTSSEAENKSTSSFFFASLPKLMVACRKDRRRRAQEETKVTESQSIHDGDERCCGLMISMMKVVIFFILTYRDVVWWELETENSILDFPSFSFGRCVQKQD